MFEGEHLSGAAETRLDFVEHEKRFIFRTEFSKAFEEAIRWDDDARFSLDRFDQDPMPFASPA